MTPQDPSSDEAGNAVAAPALVGVDTGGTFTDLVHWNGERLIQCKVLSTPDDPSRAILQGLERLGLAQKPVQLVHGTTVGTNAVLEGKGVPVAYVTSAGFADVLTLARQNRREVYALEPRPTPVPVPSSHCLEVATRSDAQGRLLARADRASLDALAAKIAALGVESVAVNLLFAFLCPEEEQRIAARLPDHCFVSLSSQVLPELREYERGIATWLNASVGPLMERYLKRLESALPAAQIAVMQSAGTTVAASRAAAGAVRLLLSGPAGGIAAARLIGAVTGHERLMTLDMGGTSTDVSLLDGEIPLTTRSRIAGWPLTISTVDIHTIGAGGGSIARVDAAGMLLVGPESAGASPGPACYGQGGEAVTVTDANLLLGRLPPDTKLGGYLPLDVAGAERAFAELAAALGSSAPEAAAGVIRVANEHMARALRVMSVERGYDPRDYTLMCFGGAGGLHACEVAELLGMRTVLLPALAGVLSAQGMLASEPGRDLSQAVLQPLGDLDDDALDQAFEALKDEAESALLEEGVSAGALSHRERVELRYLGQNDGIVLDRQSLSSLGEAYHQAHEQAAGHRLDRAVELVNLRLSTRAEAPLASLQATDSAHRSDSAGSVYLADLRREAPVRERSAIDAGEVCEGPAIFRDAVATVWLPPSWQAALDAWGNLVLTRRP